MISSLLIILTTVVTLTSAQDTFYFNIKPQSKNVTEGSETRLFCDVSERRHIYFQWLQNNKAIVNSTRKYQEDSNLRILRVVRGEDNGSYRCIATNSTTSFSMSSQKAELDIQWISPTAKVLLKRPRQDEVVAGADVTLRCLVDGNPRPTVLWKHNTFRLFQSTKVRIVDKDHKLRLINVTEADNGVYSCSGSNMAGDAESGEGNFILNIDGTDSPRLRVSEFTPFQLGLKYQPARLDCPFEDVTRIDWFFNNEKLSNGTGRHVVYSNGSLYFHRVRSSDEGTYRCEGLSSRGPAQTFTAELALADLDDITSGSFEPRLSPSSPVVMPVGQRFEIKVFPPSGRPAPDYRWLDRNDRVVPDFGAIRTSGPSLVFEAPSEQDSGNYTFMANNTAGERRRSVWVVVSVPPIISRVPKAVIAEEDKNASFTCGVSATLWPVTTIVWTRNGSFLPMGTNDYIMDLKTGSLFIPKVRADDAGDYACVANTSGHPVRVSSTAALIVQRKLKFNPPLRGTYYLELDKQASIDCKAEGMKPPRISWLMERNGQFFHELPGHIRENGGTLHFSKVMRSDEGKYLCIATQRKQGIINSTVNVRIVEKPKITIRPPNITTVFEGQPTMLHCVAVGDPRPTVVWEKDGRRIVGGVSGRVTEQSRYVVFNNGTLLLSKVLMEDKGQYCCTANNSAGNDRAEFSLRITQPIEDDEGFDMAQTVVIAVCSAGAYLALVIGLTAFCSYRLLLQRRERKQIMNGKAVKLSSSEFHQHREQHELLMKDRDSGLQFRTDSDNRSHASALSSHPSHSSTSATGPSTLATALAMRSRGAGLDKFQYPRHDLHTLGVIGKGQFGDVFLAKARSIRPIEAETLVVVKSLIIKGDAAQVDFHNEVDMYSKLDHPHVVRLLGVCREVEPHFMITEYCDWGDLKQFLLATRSDSGRRVMASRVPSLTVQQKLKLCQQVALGMEYLAGHKFIHRDLAARNVLLTSRLDLKICSLSLCRDVYQGEYFQHPNRQMPVPLRWLPPEAVRDCEYSFHTDIWSYGIFMWEVFHLCDLPYRLLSSEDVFSSMCGSPPGVSPMNISVTPTSTLTLPRLDFAEHVGAHVVDIVRQCCGVLPSARPTFSDVVVTLSHLMIQTNGDCV